jgi:hypothetical protein
LPSGIAVRSNEFRTAEKILLILSPPLADGEYQRGWMLSASVSRDSDGRSRGIPLKPKDGLTRISCMWHRATAVYAAFIEESRMKIINANKLHRKSGGWGT